MPISESMVQDIVQEVMAKMQIADAPAGKHGIFTDMNEAIEAAKKLLPAFEEKQKKMQKSLHVWALMRPEWEM